MAERMLHLYCLCGDSAHGSIRPAIYIEKFRRIWEQVHSGEGHGDTDQKTCEKAHRKQAVPDEAQRPRKNRLNILTASCPNCGQRFPRGVASPYLADCECGQQFVVETKASESVPSGEKEAA